MSYSLPWTPINAMQNLTPLALSSAQKSVTVQTQLTHTHKITKNSNRYIHTYAYRHVWIKNRDTETERWHDTETAEATLLRKTLASFSKPKRTSCNQHGHVVNKTLIHQNPWPWSRRPSHDPGPGLESQVRGPEFGLKPQVKCLDLGLEGR